MTVYTDRVGPLVFDPFTTAQRDALNPRPGMFLWNIETLQFEVYYEGAWRGLLLLDTAGKITAAHHGPLWSDLHQEYGQIAVPEVITAAWVLGEGGSLRGTRGNPPLGELAPPRKTTSGAPTHSAGLGSLCYVEPDDDLYQNNDGGTGWTKIAKDSPAAIAAVITNADSADTAKPRILLPCPFAGEVTKVEVKLNESETCGATSLIVDVHKITSPASDQTGTTMYTTQANRPTITNTNYYVNATLPDVVAFAQGDFLAFYIDQAGTDVTTLTIAVRADKT